MVKSFKKHPQPGSLRALFSPTLFPLIIFAAGFLLYVHILNAPKQFDDYDLLFENPLVIDLSFLARYWRDYWPKALTLFTFALNYHFAKEATFSYHLVNVLLHAFNGIFLYYVTIRLLSTPILAESHFAQRKRLFGFFTALVFVSHPLQTQAVTYLWQRAEVLSGFFYLSAFLCYLCARQGGRVYPPSQPPWAAASARCSPFPGRRITGGLHFYALGLFLFLLGLPAKGTIITLPLLIVLTEACFYHPQKAKKLLSRFWPVLVIGLLVGQIPLIKRLIKTAFIFVTASGFSLKYLYAQFVVFGKYIRLSFIPIGQNIDPDVPWANSFWEPFVVWSFIGLCLLGGLTVWLLKRHRLLGYGILWFFIYLIPTSLAAKEAMWEHRLYISLAGFSILVTGLVFTLVTERRAAVVLMTVWVALLGAVTVGRNSLWRSPIALLEDTVKKSPLKPRPHQMLGVTYYRAGMPDKAVRELQIAIALDPSYAEPHSNLGIIALKKGETEKAKAYFERAIALKEKFIAPHINLAYIYLYYGKDQGKAEALFKKSLEYKPSFEGFLGLGNLYLARKDFDRAEQVLREGLKFFNHKPEIWYTLGTVYFFKKDFPQALAMYQKTMALNKSFVDAYLNTGMIYFQTGRLRQAQEWLQKARNLRPDRKDICYRLAAVYAAQNNELKAQACLQECGLPAVDLPRR